MLFNYQTKTRKSPLNWDLNPTRHHPASTFKTRNKIKFHFFFFFRNCVSVVIENSYRESHVVLEKQSRAPRLPVMSTCAVSRSAAGRVMRAASETGCDARVRRACGRPALLVGSQPSGSGPDSPTQNPENCIFYTVLDCPNIPEHFRLRSQNFGTEHLGHSRPH